MALAFSIFGITQTLGLLAFLSLIPFIILYLRRPRPKDETIPSLMFLIQENKRSKQYSFFQRLASNILFFIQFLALTLLSLAIAIPTINIAYDVTKENTVIIIDASASMQAKDGSKTRFEKALDEAKGYVSGRNTIILAENSPVMVLEEESSDLAKDVLGRLKPRATSTNLGDALLLAKDVLGDNPGTIVVLSDFLVTEGPDVAVIKTLLTSNDRVVQFIDLSSTVENTGIIKLEVGKFTSKVHVKNFDGTEKKKTIEIKKDGKTLSTSGQITFSPYSIENFEFNTPAGVSTIEISPKDGFELDDLASLATPEKLKTNVLLVTNVEDESSLRSLEHALRAAPDINLNIAHPPVITITEDDEKIDPYKQDVIIFYRVNADSILPGTFDEIERFVSKGGVFIMAAQPDLKDIKLGKLELIEVKSLSTTPAKACVNTINSVTKNFEKEACFTTVGQHLTGEMQGKSAVFVSAQNSPLVIYKDHEAGKIAYYGIMDEHSDFRNLPSYPIFWNSLINFLVGTEDIKSFNYQTGSIATVEEQKVKTPSQTLTASKVLLDEQGIYEFGARKIAANLLSEKESAISAEQSKTSITEREALLTEGERRHDLSLVFLLSLLAFLLIFFETIFIKVRGEI